MCIIVAKPADTKMPDTETLRACFTANPDGAGFMYADGKTVKIRKGFMKFGDFLDALDDEIPTWMQDDVSIVMHFRIATHGGVKPACCHPFPLTDSKEDMRATEVSARFGVAHNGVITGRSTGAEWSDSMDFIACFMTPLAKMNPNFMHNDYATELLEDACGSKLAIMDGSGEIKTVGHFYDKEGVKFSNTSYLRTVTNWSSYKDIWYSDTGWHEGGWRTASTVRASYGIWDDDDDDDEYGLAYGEKLEDLVDALPYAACADCLWNEECALTYPVCDTEKGADSMAADILAEESEREALELGYEEDPSYYEALHASNEQQKAVSKALMTKF